MLKQLGALVLLAGVANTSQAQRLHPQTEYAHQCSPPESFNADQFQGLRIDCGVVFEVVTFSRKERLLFIGVQAVNETDSVEYLGPNSMSAMQNGKNIRVLSAEDVAVAYAKKGARTRILGGIASVIDAIGTGMGAGLHNETGAVSGTINSHHFSGTYHTISRDRAEAHLAQQGVIDRSQRVQADADSAGQFGNEIRSRYWPHEGLKKGDKSQGLVVIELDGSSAPVEVNFATNTGTATVLIALPN